jgi:hypothetical protein
MKKELQVTWMQSLMVYQSWFQENIPDYIMETECMTILAAELKPSRYNDIAEILEREFPEHYLVA